MSIVLIVSGCSSACCYMVLAQCQVGRTWTARSCTILEAGGSYAGCRVLVVLLLFLLLVLLLVVLYEAVTKARLDVQLRVRSG